MDQQESAGQWPVPEPVVRIEDERRQRQPVTVFRTAVLGCDKGRFLCLVRSISPRGLAAELDLALDAGARISISLGGAPIAAAVTASEGRRIQVAFDEPVAVEDWLAGPGAGRRHATRIEIEVQARLQIDGQCLFADVRDISQDGMRIESDHFLIEGDLAAITLRGWTGTIHARICWTSGGQAGLAFAEPLRLPALMHWVAALAPAARRPRSRRDIRQMVRH
jgi:hypothetical protein